MNPILNEYPQKIIKPKSRQRGIRENSKKVVSQMMKSKPADDANHQRNGVSRGQASDSTRHHPDVPNITTQNIDMFGDSRTAAKNNLDGHLTIRLDAIEQSVHQVLSLSSDSLLGNHSKRQIHLQ